MWLARIAVAGALACGSKQPGTAEPTCTQVADHMLVLLANDERARDIHDVFQTRCERDHWAAAPRRCVTETASLKDPRGCKAKLTGDQRSALDTDLAAVEDRARDRPPAECLEYERVMARVAACSKLPQLSRESLARAYESSKATWKRNPDRAATAAACRSGADNTRRAIASTCGS